MEESNSFLDPNFALKLFGGFGQITGTVNKVKFILDELRKTNIVVQPKTVKSDKKSNDLLEEGNKCFNMKDKAMLLKALELFNESICNAGNSSEELGIGYASRSAVYFELKQFEICLRNIILAKQNGCPANLMPQLDKREGDCLKQLRLLDRKNTKLNLTSHKNTPFVADCLELKADSVNGRYIVTTEDLNPGEIIAIEWSFAQVLSNECIYQRCSNCFKKSFLNLLPCPGCTKAMFCSDSCFEDGYKTFHKFECPIIECLMNVGGQITMRTFLKAVQSFGCIEELTKFLQSTDLHDVTARSLDQTKKLSAQEQYHQIHSLATNQETRSPLDLFTHAMIAALFYYQLIKYTSFKDLINGETSDETEVGLLELMFRMELVASINSFNIGELTSSLDFTIIGTGLYQLNSLLNHSCCPNACPTFIDSKLILYTTQPVEKGESISISYNGGHALASKQNRQSFLYEKYHFQCQCTACVNDFPLQSNMVLADIPEIHTNNRSIQLNRMISEDIFEKCRSYLTSYHRHYPCKEILSAKECLQKIMSFLLANGMLALNCLAGLYSRDLELETSLTRKFQSCDSKAQIIL